MTMQDLPLAGLRVMVVEDETIVSLMIEDALLEQDCIVVGPYSRVASALAAAQSEALDAALLDVNLAGAKVYPVAEILATRGVPFLLLSGYGQDAAPSTHPEWRAFSKPFQPEALIEQLREQIRRQ